jgi:hypothetical protein
VFTLRRPTCQEAVRPLRQSGRHLRPPTGGRHLQSVQEHLALLTNWVARTVAELPPRHANLIRPFAEWHSIRDARRRSSRGRYTYAAHKGDCGDVP